MSQSQANKFARGSNREAYRIVAALHFLEREEVHVPLHAYNERPFIETTRRAIDPPDGIRPEWQFYRDPSERIGKPLFRRHPMTPAALVAGMLNDGGMVSLEDINASEHGLPYADRTMGHLWDLLDAEQQSIDVCPAALAAQLCDRIELKAQPQDPGFRLISRRRNAMMNSSLSETSGSATPDETADTAEMSSRDAERLGLHEGEDVMVESSVGQITLRLKVSEDVRSGTIVIAHGWGSPLYDPRTGDEVFCKGNARNKLVSDNAIDRFSGVPQLNGLHVSVQSANLAQRP